MAYILDAASRNPDCLEKLLILANVATIDALIVQLASKGLGAGANAASPQIRQAIQRLKAVDGGGGKSPGGSVNTTVETYDSGGPSLTFEYKYKRSIADNKADGRAWEKKIDSNPAPGHRTASEVTMVVDTPDGLVRIRADQLIKNNKTGVYSIVEAKGSASASLTKNQVKALPALQKGATATIRGKNGAPLGLNPGDQIKVENVLIVRPTGVSTP